MASRDIANMHFFLDLKKKFPDLPEDLLRSHVSLFSEDPEKCIRLLQKESQNHYHLSSQPFSDFRLPEGRGGNARRDDSNKDTARSMPLDLGSGTTPCSVKPESRSAPVIHANREPFSDMYRQKSVSSQNTVYHLPGQTMFSTTKEHRVGLPEPRTDLNREQSERHTVRLSITPSFPFQQQNVSSSAHAGTSYVGPPTSHSSRLGRHTTSVNFQLQPRDQRPFVISTIPSSVANPSHSGSHVQISVGTRGATFTALRFQHLCHLPSEESSQAQNSYFRSFSDQSPNSDANWKNSSTQHLSGQMSPSYILAVKNEQIVQLDSILNELEKEKALCSQLRAEVKELERIAQNNNSNTSFSYAEKVNQLRKENKELRMECNCLYIETDMYDSSEIPPCETEDFYSQIFTGPNGTILPCAKDLAESERQNCHKSEREEDDENKSNWVCKKCTFANHPALEKCEICELPKDIESVDSTGVCFPPPKGLPPRASGSVQISITHSPKNVKFHVARKTAR